MNAIYDSIASVVARRFRIDRSAVVPEASFEELGLDSLSLIELTTSIKKELGFTISDNDIAQMSTISDIIQLLEQQGVEV